MSDLPVFVTTVFDDLDILSGREFQRCEVVSFRVCYLLSDPDDIGSSAECWIMRDFGDHWGNVADIEDGDEGTMRRAREAVAYIVAHGSAPSEEEFEAMGEVSNV